MRGRRRRLFIYRIKHEDGDWFQGDKDIAEAVCNHFQQIFTMEEKLIEEEILNCIPTLVT